MNPFAFVILGAILLVLLFLARAALRMVQPYARRIISVLGRWHSAQGRGLLLVFPFLSRTRNVDLRLSGDPSDTFFL